MEHPDAYRNKEVVILGLARSGRAVAEIFHRAGAIVTASDLQARHLCPEADELEAMGITVICGHHPHDLVHSNVALLVKNPGIPYSARPIEQALDLGIEVVTEVEVAYQFCEGRMIGITGSNGKTTTTTWIGEMLELAGHEPLIAGNIGKALCEAALEAKPDQWLVVELSSFQLKGTVDFSPHIACLLNISPSHLDYHHSMDDYVTSKQRLLEKQTLDDIAVINWDDQLCRQMAADSLARIVPFSVTEKLAFGAYLNKGWIVYRSELGAEEQMILPAEEIGLRGIFNLENALAAVAVAIEVGLKIEQIAPVLKDFRGVEHRLEFVNTFEGIQFYNNSKSTNAPSTIKALEAFMDQPIVLIAGGLDRGSSYEELIPTFTKQVKGLVTLGQTKHILNNIAEQAGVPFIRSVDQDEDAALAIKQAVSIAFSLAQPGDIVMLSPACASWDMFESYETRGSMFKQAVHTLK